MSYFLRTCDATSPIFRKYAAKYADSLDMPLDSEEDHEAVFRTIADAPSFNSKGPIVKLMRWFAWYGHFAWQESPHSRTNRRAEFWAAKMVYEHNLALGGEDVNHVDLAAVLRDVDMSPQEQLRRLKAASGGFKLAHKVMSDDLYMHCKILFCVGQPAWRHHVYKVEKVLTPLDGLSFLTKQSLGAWRDELVAILEATFASTANLQYWKVHHASHLDDDAILVCEHAAVLGIHLVSNRAWSKFLDVSIPPQSYAAILLPACDPRDERMRQMKCDWRVIMDLEARSLTDLSSAALRQELFWADFTPVRLMYMLFERGAWDPDFPPARDFLRALLEVLPDSRVVEEHHEKLRDMSRSCKHNVTTRVARMQSCRSAGVLERRGINAVSVSNDQFVDEYRRPVDINRLAFESANRSLNQGWEDLKLPGVRHWASPTPNSSRHTAAAWHWARVRGVSAHAAARASCALSPFQIVRNVVAGHMYLVLEVAKWGAMALRVTCVVDNDVFSIARDADTVQVIHATAVEHQYVVIPTAVCTPGRLRYEHPRAPRDTGITYRRTGPDEGLLNFMFKNKVSLSAKDLLFIAAELGIPHRQSSSKKDLVSIIATYLASGLPDDQQNCFVNYAVQQAAPADEDGDCDHLIDDDTEAVFDLMESDNKDDFKDFGDGIKRRNFKARSRSARNLNALAKARGMAKVKAKAKAKAPLPEEPPPPPPPPPPVEDPPPPPPPVAPHVRGGVENRGDAVKWGAFTIGLRPATVDKPHGSCWARCPFHDPDISANGVGLLTCTREWNLLPEDGLDKTHMIQMLKWWCVSGSTLVRDRKTGHMNLCRSATNFSPGAAVPNEARLLELRRQWDELAVARGIPMVAV